MSLDNTDNIDDKTLVPIDFSMGVLNRGRSNERRGDKRAAMKSYAHAWRAGSSDKNLTLAALAREEMFSMALMVHDIAFSSNQYQELISVFSVDHRLMAAWAHHDIGKIYRNAWQHGELLNPSSAIEHFIAARDEFVNLWEARSAALAEMDLAHVYIHISRIEEAIVLLESARAAWKSLDEHYGSAECALSIGDCLTLLGRNEDAVNIYKEAASDFEKAGDPLQVNLAHQRANSDNNLV